MVVRRGILFAIAMSWVVPILASAQERPYEWGWGMHPMGWMGGFWGVGMMFMMLLFWILVIAAIVFAVRWLVSQDKGGRSDSSMEILRQRYARGEINKEEFEAKKRDLS
jgi:putative membrane protein